MSSFDTMHPSQDDLLRYCDGELDEMLTEEVRGHLEVCWQCRAELDDLQAAVKRCVQYGTAFMDTVVPPPTKTWADLRQLSARAERPSNANHLARTLLHEVERRITVWRVVAAMGTAVAVGLLLFVLAPNKNVPTSPTGEDSSHPVASVPPQEKPKAGQLPPARERPPSPRPRGPAALAAKDLLDVFVTLHQMNADLDELVEVRRSGNRVVIHAVVRTAERRTALEQALKQLQRTEARIVVVEATGGTAAQAPFLGGFSRTAPRPAGETGFGPDDRATVARAARVIGGRTRAVERLAMSFPTDIESKLSATAQVELRRIVEDHLRAVGLSHDEIAGVLKKFATPSDSPPRGPVRARVRSWQECAVSLARLAGDLGRFQSTPTEPKVSGEQELTALRTAATALGAAIAQFRAALGQKAR
ncbi:MAG: hypothetical protein K2X35_15095 [Bryobacteraceae bacterium]|jgi:hypothetical protein|nr:hypothetical protein [Bryobacteraceae bacterium]